MDNDDTIIVDLAQIEEITKKIVKTDFLSGRALTSEQKVVGVEISEVSYKIFTEENQIAVNSGKKFSIFKDKIFQKTQDKDGEIDTQNLIEINEFFQNNSVAFHVLVAQHFFGKPKKGYENDNHLFYVEVRSKYSNESIGLFFIKKDKSFLIVLQKAMKIPIIDYLSDYFGCPNDTLRKDITALAQDNTTSHEELQNKLTVLFNLPREKLFDDSQLQEGVITFMDFLGWKGLWQNNSGNPLKVVNELIEEFSKELEKKTIELLPNAIGIKVSRLISISDTIAIFTPKVNSLTESDLIRLHSYLAKTILEHTVKYEFAIRGAITYGEYNYQNNIMIGPGIDECASWHEKCDWIGVHFTPSAQFVIEDKKLNKDDIMSYDKIPLKSGVPKIKYCIKWYITKDEYNNLLKKVKAIVPEIASKYLNTKDFLDIVNEQQRSNNDE